MKHNNTMSDLGEQIDQLNANKVKSEKDKSGLELDLRDARLDLEDAVKAKAELDKQGKLLQAAIVDANTRLDEMARALNEAESTRLRWTECWLPPRMPRTWPRRRWLTPPDLPTSWEPSRSTCPASPLARTLSPTLWESWRV